MACVWSWLRMILERLVEGAKISWNDNVSSTSKLDMATDIGNSKEDLIIRRSVGFNVSSPKSILSLTATNPFGVCIFIHIHLHIHIYNTIIYFHFRNMYTHMYVYVYIYIYHHHIHIYYNIDISKVLLKEETKNTAHPSPCLHWSIRRKLFRLAPWLPLFFWGPSGVKHDLLGNPLSMVFIAGKTI